MVLLRGEEGRDVGGLPDVAVGVELVSGQLLLQFLGPCHLA